MKEQVKERAVKNDAAQTAVLEASAKDERLHKKSLAKMSVAEKKYQIKAQLAVEQKNEKKIKEKITRLPGGIASDSMSDLAKKENKVKEDLLYRAKNGKHLQLRVASTEFKLSAADNKYLNRAIDLLHAIDEGKSQIMLYAVEDLLKTDDALQDVASKLVLTDSALISADVKKDLQSLSKEVTEANDALEKTLQKNRIVSLKEKFDAPKQPSSDESMDQQEKDLNKADAESVDKVADDEAAREKNNRAMSNAFDLAFRKHTQLTEEVGRVYRKLASQGRVEHKIDISNEEIRAAQWKDLQSKKDNKRLRGEVELFRKMRVWDEAHLQKQMTILYKDRLGSYDSLRIQADELAMEPKTGVKEMLEKQKVDLKSRESEARETSDNLGLQNKPLDFIAAYVHQGHMQECLTKELEILTTIVSLRKTKSTSELTKSKKYLTGLEISYQKEMNNLMLRKEKRLRKEVKLLYVGKLGRLDRDYNVLGKQTKLLKKRYMFHIKREKIVQMYEELQKKHKEMHQKMTAKLKDLDDQLENHRKEHDRITQAYDKKIMGAKAKNAIQKYEELVTKRNGLHEQVKHLEKVMTGNHKPSELRLIVSKMVSGGANGDWKTSPEELTKFTASTAGAKFKAPEFESHSHEKTANAAAALNEKVKRGEITKAQALDILKRLGLRKQDKNAEINKIKEIDAMEKADYAKAETTHATQENDRLRRQLEAMRKKLEVANEKELASKRKVKQTKARMELEKQESINSASTDSSSSDSSSSSTKQENTDSAATDSSSSGSSSTKQENTDSAATDSSSSGSSSTKQENTDSAATDSSSSGSSSTDSSSSSGSAGKALDKALAKSTENMNLSKDQQDAVKEKVTKALEKIKKGEGPDKEVEHASPAVKEKVEKAVQKIKQVKQDEVSVEKDEAKEKVDEEKNPNSDAVKLDELEVEKAEAELSTDEKTGNEIKQKAGEKKSQRENEIEVEKAETELDIKPPPASQSSSASSSEDPSSYSGGKVDKDKISSVIDGFKKSKAKVVAMRAEIMTLRARKALMQKENIKGRLNPSSGKGAGRSSGSNRLGASYEPIHPGAIKLKLRNGDELANAHSPFIVGGDEVSESHLSLGESMEDSHTSRRASQLLDINEQLISAQRQYHKLKRALARREEDVHVLATRLGV